MDTQGRAAHLVVGVAGAAESDGGGRDHKVQRVVVVQPPLVLWHLARHARVPRGRGLLQWRLDRVCRHCLWRGRRVCVRRHADRCVSGGREARLCVGHVGLPRRDSCGRRGGVLRVRIAFRVGWCCCSFDTAPRGRAGRLAWRGDGCGGIGESARLAAAEWRVWCGERRRCGRQQRSVLLRIPRHKRVRLLRPCARPPGRHGMRTLHWRWQMPEPIAKMSRTRHAAAPNVHEPALRHACLQGTRRARRPHLRTLRPSCRGGAPRHSATRCAAAACQSIRNRRGPRRPQRPGCRTAQGKGRRSRFQRRRPLCRAPQTLHWPPCG